LEDGVRHFDAHALKSLQHEVETLSKLIDDLYDLSLADVGRLRYRKVSLDVDEVLKSAAELFQERIGKAGIRLELKLPSDPINIYADERRLHQVFANLIEN